MVGKTEDTVIFFHATWCPSCRAADDAISSEVIPDRLTILKANFDNSTDLRKKYGVVAQHTFVQVDPNGNEVKKWLGGFKLSLSILTIIRVLIIYILL
jgi:thioredoxin 1